MRPPVVLVSWFKASVRAARRAHPRSMHSALVVALASAHALGSSACVPRPRMCTVSTECTGKSSCVAGRCQLDDARVKPALDSARRLVVRPVDAAYVKRGDGRSEGASSSPIALGREGGKLFLRFSFSLPSAASIVEAYIVLHRSTIVDDEPTSISLHATRIVEAWDGRSISWARQPRETESRSPSSLVAPFGSAMVRVDVRELVRHWTRHDRDDHGIAIVAENDTPTGMTFAGWAAGEDRGPNEGRGGAGRREPSGSPAPDVEPYLELYVR